MTAVYHGTAARFPINALTSGPDTASLLGKPIPGLWLTENPAMAAVYASWSADCTGGAALRIIVLEMNEDCPRRHNPSRPEDLLVSHPEDLYQAGMIRILRAHRVRRRPIKVKGGRGWRLSVPELDVTIATPSARVLASLPQGSATPSGVPSFLRRCK